MNGVTFYPISPIYSSAGDIRHALKKSDAEFTAFGEAYFSTVNPGFVKGWTRHKRMTLNLLVCRGAVRIVMYDDRSGSATHGHFLEQIMDCGENYGRLTVAPGLWVAFCGMPEGTILNLADIEHDPAESDKLDLQNIVFDW